MQYEGFYYSTITIGEDLSGVDYSVPMFTTGFNNVIARMQHMGVTRDSLYVTTYANTTFIYVKE